MEHKALELIQKTAIVANGQVLPENLRTVVTVLPDGGLADLEQYQPGRRRFRGIFSTKSLTDFAAYARAVAPEGAGAQGFVEAGSTSLQAVVFFNLGSAQEPGHGDWRAVLTPQSLAAYEALLAINGRAQNQRGVQSFIEDWAHAVAGVSIEDDGSRHVWPQSRLLAAVRNLTIKRAARTDSAEGSYAASASVLESVEASSESGLPDLLTFTTPPYLDLPQRTFDLRLSVTSGAPDEKPQLTLRIIGLEAHKEAIAQDFKKALREALGEGFPLVLGTFKP